jgi:hypothetical protein
VVVKAPSCFTGCPHGCVSQLRLAHGSDLGSTANLAKVREFLWRLAECYDRIGCLAHAELQLKDLLCMEVTPEQRIEALCFLADVQVRCRLNMVTDRCLWRWMGRTLLVTSA